MSNFTIFNLPGEEWSKKTNSWERFYNSIKDSHWPDCCNEGQFFKLPKHIQDEVLTLHNGRQFIFPNDNDFEDLSDFKPLVNSYDNLVVTDLKLKYQVGTDFFVYYDDFMNAGGTGYVQSYPRIIRYCYPNRKFSKCLDWCAGAGFLGFRLLADEICDSVTLMDCYRPSLDACKKTIYNMPNKFKNKVELVNTDAIHKLDKKIKYDLIVGNPPGLTTKRYSQDTVTDPHEARLTIDQDWQIHKEFFKNVHSILASNGVIILQKLSEIHDIKDFDYMVETSGLEVIQVLREKKDKFFWYLVLGKK
jgi:16S rRNA G966 N2-methylase RsmD